MRTRFACWSLALVAALAAIILVGSQALQSRAQIATQDHTPVEGSQGVRTDGAQGIRVEGTQHGIRVEGSTQGTRREENQRGTRIEGSQQGLRTDGRQGNASHSYGQEEKRCKASDVISMEVRGVNGDEKIGSINDLMLGQDGRVKYVAVSFGGFLGMGDKLFAVPFEAIDFAKTDNEAFARIDVTEATLKLKQGFNQDKWPADADRSFTNANLRRQAATSSAAR